MKSFKPPIIAFGYFLLSISPACTATNGNIQDEHKEPYVNVESSFDAKFKEEELITAKKEQIINEAANAANATENAIRAIAHSDLEPAKASLALAGAHLHLLLANNPGLNLIPIDIKAKTNQLNVSIRTKK